MLMLCIVILLAVGGAGWRLYGTGFGKSPVPPSAGHGMPQPPGFEGLPELPPPDLFRPLTAEEAKTANDQRPIFKHAVTPATAFRAQGDPQSKLRALDCLTQAVYYEAASEGVDGGRAVAQVVLNRIRHPGFPNSVCGTVYQGTGRPTGCQFTFTCDGSLARIPIGSIWAQSRKIAAEALAGRVFPLVGQATHYHADYVLPYWADSLDKVAVIGRHIFYQLRGSNGSRAAFGQPYAGAEPLPIPTLSIDTLAGSDPLLAQLPEAPALPHAKVEEDRIEALAEGTTAGTKISEPIQADFNRGKLIAGEPPAAPKAKLKSDDECGPRGIGQLKPIQADNLKATPGKTIC